MEQGQGTPGEMKIVAGIVMISNGKMWLPYPETAHDLIQTAQDHGWGFDDGIPVRVDPDGVPYVRILIGRESGENAHEPGTVVQGQQFHIMWRMPNPKTDPRKRSWTLAEIYVKTSKTGGTWERVPSLKTVRAAVSGQPVQVPNGYVAA